MPNDLLSLIAQPQIANIPGRYQQGQLQAQQLQQGQLSLQQQTQQLAAGEQKASNAQEAKQLQNTAFDLAVAASVSGDQQTQMIQRLVSNLEGTNFGQSEFITKLASMPPGKERDALIFEGVADAQDLGILPGLEARQKQEALASKGGATIGAQKILEDGTIIQSTSSGPKVYNPQGQLVVGEEAAEAVAVARAEEVSNARKAAGGRRAAALEAEAELKAVIEAKVVSAKKGAEISAAAFDKLEGVYKNISNIQEGIDLLDQGAKTGVIEKYLPSIRSASRRLDNLQGRLGLDIIRNTTFGSLSEAELRFALDTALPKGLDEPELKRWLTEKKGVQEKLADYIEASALFLGKPGNTVAGWIEKQKMKRTQGPKPTQPSSVIKFDAQGNRL